MLKDLLVGLTVLFGLSIVVYFYVVNVESNYFPERAYRLRARMTMDEIEKVMGGPCTGGGVQANAACMVWKTNRYVVFVEFAKGQDRAIYASVNLTPWFRKEQSKRLF